jgi:pimeloyl-ACP methyl ester carboxylesterase
LEGWFIPASGSDKLIIANHPMGFSRAGIPAHLEPWKSVWALSGNDFEVNLIPDYKILHDAGYNVLAYDLRNFGLSGAANGGIASSGIFEARDVAGSLAYARSRPDTRDMTIGLFSRCLGCSSTFAAMTQFPEAFVGVRCLVGPQPVTMKTIVARRLALLGVPATGSTTSSSASSCRRASDSRDGRPKNGPGTSACPPSSTRYTTTC